MYQLLFLLSLIVFRKDIFGQSGDLILYGVTLFLFLIKNKDNKAIKSVSILFLPILIASWNGIVSYGLFIVFKDIFYFLQPVILVLLGHLIAQNYSKRDLINAILIVGGASSVFFLVTTLYESGLYALIDPRRVRDIQDGSMVNFITLFSCAIFLFQIMNDKVRHSKKLYILFILNFMAIYASGSRTRLISIFILLLIVIYPQIKRNKAFLLKLVGVVSITLVLYLNYAGDSSMLKMIEHSSQEIHVENYKSAKKINENYRGYEAYKAMRLFHSFRGMEQFFGRGFGTMVDIGNSELVGIRFLPILHNGYPYILIKSGLFGLLIFILWGTFLFYKIAKYKTTGNDELLLKLLSLGNILVLFVINASVTGIFNGAYNCGWIIVGAMLEYIIIDRKKNADFSYNCKL